MSISNPNSVSFFLPSVPPGPPIVGEIPADKIPVVLSDFDIPLHINIRNFRSSLKPILLTLADLDYHSNRYWEGILNDNLIQSDAPIVGDEGWFTYGLLMDDMDLLTMDQLDLLTMSQIESSAGIGEVAPWSYSPGIVVDVPTSGATFSSFYDHDNLLVAPFDEPGTYYIELVLRDFPAKLGSPTIDHLQSYISFSSSTGNIPSETDFVAFVETIANIDAGGNVVWRINRDRLVNCDTTNIKRIDFYLKATGGTVTFKAEALRLLRSDNPYYDIAIDTKTGTLAKNPSQKGTNILAQTHPQPIMNVGTNQGINLSEIIRFNTGHHPSAPLTNEFSVFLRADTGSGEYIEVVTKCNDDETQVEIYEGGVGVRQFSVDPLDENKDHFLQIDLVEDQIRVVIWEALGNYPTNVKLNTEDDDNVILVGRTDPGRVALDFRPHNADFTIDYMFAREASIAELITKSFESITPVNGVTLYSNYSPAKQILDRDSIEEGPAVNLLRIPVLDSGEENGDFLIVPNINDVTVSLDNTIVFEDSPASYRVRKQLRNAFIGGVQWDTTVKINDPLNAIIRGAVRFDEKLNYGKFRVVLFDKFWENVAFVSTINVDNLVLGKWNEFEIPVLNEKIYHNEFKIQFQHIGIDDSYLATDDNAVGTFWLDNLRIETSTIVWEASNDNGLTYMRFFDTIGGQYQGINFPTLGNQLRLRARAFDVNAWVNGFQAIVHYSQPGRILE
jgi:hypothetical protein